MIQTPYLYELSIDYLFFNFAVYPSYPPCSYRCLLSTVRPDAPHSAPHSAPLRSTPLQALKHERILSPQGKLTQLRLARTYCTATENTREKLSDLLNKNDASYMMTDVSLNGILGFDSSSSLNRG